MKLTAEMLMDQIRASFRFGKTKDNQYVYCEKEVKKDGKDGKRWKYIDAMKSDLCRLAYENFNSYLKGSTLKDVEEMLLNAINSGTQPVEVYEIPSGIRVVGHEGAIYVDAGKSVIRISKEEIKRVETPENIAFLRNDVQLPLPPLSKTADLKKLKEILNLSEKDWWKVLFAVLSAMRPMGPFPILFISGPPGSGKTTMAKVFKRLLDPEVGEVSNMPNRLSDLKLMASQCRVMVIDNTNKISSAIEDALCVMATGGANKLRTLYKTTDLTISEYKSVMILTGIGKCTNRTDLLDRMVVIETAELKDLRTEAEIFSEFEEHRASIQQGLFNTIQAIIANDKHPPVATKSRMQDAVNFASRAEAYLGLEDGFFAKIADEWSNEIRTEIADESALVQVVSKVMDRKSACQKEPAEYRLERKPTEMLNLLLDSAHKFQLRDKDLPKTPSALGKKLQELKPALRVKGILVKRHNSTKKDGRTIELYFSKLKKQDIIKALEKKPVKPKDDLDEIAF